MPIEKVDPFQAEIQDLQDLPMRHRERIWHFFEHYKALEQGKWAKITGWGDKAEAQRILMEAIERYNKASADRRLSRPAPLDRTRDGLIRATGAGLRLAPGASNQR